MLKLSKGSAAAILKVLQQTIMNMFQTNKIHVPAKKLKKCKEIKKKQMETLELKYTTGNSVDGFSRKIERTEKRIGELKENNTNCPVSTIERKLLF
jgi:hypothetical protein